MKIFTSEKLSYIIDVLKDEIKKINSHEIYEFQVLNPSFSNELFDGEEVLIDEINYIYRGFGCWLDLSQKLFCKMLTPKILDEKSIVIGFYKLDKEENFHKKSESSTEKYGTDSIFSRINKCEETSFIYDYVSALKAVKVNEKQHILNLGINSGDEFVAIKDLVFCEDKKFVGIDFSKSALEKAREKLKNENFNFICEDINNIDNLSLGKFDLIISIGTLQSTTLNFKTFFMSLVQNYLEDRGAIILGFPNCRWIDGTMIYGSQPPNYNYSEMSILYNDVMFCKKYLQQKKYRVTITGKDYIFLTATSIKK